MGERSWKRILHVQSLVKVPNLSQQRSHLLVVHVAYPGKVDGAERVDEDIAEDRVEDEYTTMLKLLYVGYAETALAPLQVDEVEDDPDDREEEAEATQRPEEDQAMHIAVRSYALHPLF